MDQPINLVKNVITQIETVLNRGLDNVYINTTIKVLIGLYAGFAAPKLPPTLVNLMDNVIVRTSVAFIIVLMATRDPPIALMIAVAFIITLQTANKHRLINTSLSVPGQRSWLPSARKPKQVASNGNSPENFAMRSYIPQNQGADPEDVAIASASNLSDNLSKRDDFTTCQQFDNAQNNQIPKENPQSCLTSFDNQHCTQNMYLNAPEGANL